MREYSGPWPARAKRIRFSRHSPKPDYPPPTAKDGGSADHAGASYLPPSTRKGLSGDGQSVDVCPVWV
jgi:hypothetical protein